MKILLFAFLLCLGLALADFEGDAEKKEPVKVPVLPYPSSYYYPYHYYPYPSNYYKPVSSYAYSYGTHYYPPAAPYNYRAYVAPTSYQYIP